jgi:hypothetical protein
MFDKIKEFIEDHPVEIILAATMTVTVVAALYMNRTTLKGGAFLELSGEAVKDLADGKTILVDALDDVYLAIQTVPKS